MLQQVLKNQTTTIRVMIIDDYKLSRLGLKTVLSKDDEIELIGEAEDGETGLQLVHQLLPDVVLMDLSLPGIDGIEATRRLKALHEEIKVIVLTSHTEEENVLAALEAGANAYCVKSHSTHKLVETIKEVFDGAAWLDSAIAETALKILRKSLQNTTPEHTPTNRVSLNIELTEHEFDVLRLIAEGKGYCEDCGMQE
jgi:DNA-binding NarL/FixJ family response regulator